MKPPACWQAAAVFFISQGLFTGLFTGRTEAHELPAQRATLVQRDANHVSISFQLRYGEWLQRALAPRSTPQAFLGRLAAMPLPEFTRALQQAQRGFEESTRVTRADASQVPLQAWRWPHATRVQALLQQRAMQAIAAPAEHGHEDTLEVQAELTAPAGVDGLLWQWPAELQPLLVVSYRPQQTWARPGAPPMRIHFGSATR